MIIIALFIFTFTLSYGQLTNLDSRCLWILRDSMTSKTAIDNAANTDAVAALFVVYEGDGKTVKSGVLYDWPELET